MYVGYTGHFWLLSVEVIPCTSNLWQDNVVTSDTQGVATCTWRLGINLMCFYLASDQAESKGPWASCISNVLHNLLYTFHFRIAVVTYIVYTCTCRCVHCQKTLTIICSSVPAVGYWWFHETGTWPQQTPVGMWTWGAWSETLSGSSQMVLFGFSPRACSTGRCTLQLLFFLLFLLLLSFLLLLLLLGSNTLVTTILCFCRGTIAFFMFAVTPMTSYTYVYLFGSNTQDNNTRYHTHWYKFSTLCWPRPISVNQEIITGQKCMSNYWVIVVISDISPARKEQHCIWHWHKSYFRIASFPKCVVFWVAYLVRE